MLIKIWSVFWPACGAASIIVQSSLEEIIGSENIARNNLRWNFIEVIMTENKVMYENLVVIRQLWEIHLDKRVVRPITADRSLDAWDWSHAAVTDANFSKSMHNNQIFMNDFVLVIITSLNFKLKLLSEFFLLYMNSITLSMHAIALSLHTIYNKL